MSDFDFGQHMEGVAAFIFGDPNKKLSKPGQNRYGKQGSISVDLEKGTYFDHEDKIGGGVLQLLKNAQELETADAIEWLRERGFEVPERDPKPGSNRAAKREIVATYDYENDEGELVFQVCRWEPKTFTQRRPFGDEKDVWINGLKADEYMRKGPGKNWARFNEDRYKEWGCTERREFPALTDLPLYRVPDLNEAIAEERPIFLVEGEKDANNLWKMSFPATTVAGGSQKWADNHSELLRGADVVIIPDNDAAGWQHMQLVGSNLKDVARSVQFLDLKAFWPEADDKQDISDWLGLAADPGGLYDYVEQLAKPWRPEPPVSRFRAVPWERLDDPGIEHEYLIDDVLTRREVAMIFGESQSGKSFEAINLGMAVARGEPYHGHKALQGAVIYQAGEGGIGVKKRLRGYRQDYLREDEKDIPLVLLPARVDLFANDDGDEKEDIETARGTSALISEVKAWGGYFDDPLELVVIDTLATATPGANENASTDMSVVLKNCERIARECRCAVLLVHHKPKSGNGPRGHTSMFANIENAIEITVTERNDIEERTDGNDLVRQIRRAVVTKNKDGEAGHGWDFILKQVVLGQRDDGKLITTCVVADPGGNRGSDDDRKKLTDQQHMAMSALIKALENSGEPTPAALKLGSRIHRVCKYPDWKAEYAKLSFIDDEDESKQRERVKSALKRSGEKFLRNKWIGRADKYVWLTGRPVPGFEVEGEIARSAPDMQGDFDMGSLDTGEL